MTAKESVPVSPHERSTPKTPAHKGPGAKPGPMPYVSRHTGVQRRAEGGQARQPRPRSPPRAYSGDGPAVAVGAQAEVERAVGGVGEHV